MSNGKILVVDDEPDVREVIQSRLESEGYQVLTAENGVEALRLIQAEEPDLIFLDILMPKMDGYEVCRNLRESDNQNIKDTPIVIVTAQGMLVSEHILKSIMADDQIVKPFETEVLIEKVKEHLKA